MQSEPCFCWSPCLIFKPFRRCFQNGWSFSPTCCLALCPCRQLYYVLLTPRPFLSLPFLFSSSHPFLFNGSFFPFRLVPPSSHLLFLSLLLLLFLFSHCLSVLFPEPPLPRPISTSVSLLLIPQGKAGLEKVAELLSIFFAEQGSLAKSYRLDAQLSKG